MRLSTFIMKNKEAILAEFEEFARSHTEAGAHMDMRALRDHASAILDALAADIEASQSAAEQTRKSKGDATPSPDASDTGAEQHGADRAESGFSLEEMVAEYRALRASVLRLWVDSKPRLGSEEMADLIRFNEGIDQALAESTARYARQLEESREMFIAVLGHDLRTPLSAVLTASSFLESAGTLQGADLTMARQIRRSGQRMNGLVGDLLDFTLSRLGHGIRIVPERTNIRDLAEQTIAEIQSLQHGVKIHLEGSGDLEGSWDPARVMQGLSNLIGNAVQHGEDGGRITVSAHGEADAVAISVHNRGAKIPPDVLSRIFDPYKRILGQRAGQSIRGSLGLGLFITNQIALAHGGTVSVESTEEGTVFTLRLPRRRDA